MSKIVPISEIQEESGIQNWGCCLCSEAGAVSADATAALVTVQEDGTPLVQGLCAEHEQQELFTLVCEEDEVEEKIYPDIDSAQEALDRGDTVQIAMEPFEIDPALVRLAQAMQDKESLIAFFEQLREGA